MDVIVRLGDSAQEEASDPSVLTDCPRARSPRSGCIGCFNEAAIGVGAPDLAENCLRRRWTEQTINLCEEASPQPRIVSRVQQVLAALREPRGGDCSDGDGEGDEGDFELTMQGLVPKPPFGD